MRFTLKPIYRDVLWTAVTQFMIVLLFFLLFRLLAVHYGTEGVGKYSLVRRVVSVLIPFLLFGLGVGLPRYISISLGPQEKASYILGGILIVTILTVIFLVLILASKKLFARVFLGHEQYEGLVLPLALLMTGIGFHTLLYSTLRGQLMVKSLNLLNFINMGLVPVTLVGLFFWMSLENLIKVMGLVMMGVTLVFAVSLSKNFLAPLNWGTFFRHVKELVVFSFPRFLASLCHVGLYSLTIILAAHYVSLSEVGFLSVSQSLLNMLGNVMAPLMLILLPKIGVMLAEKREAEVAQNLDLLMGASIQGSLFLCFQLIIFADVIIHYWLGPTFGDAVPLARIMLLAVLWYVITGPISSFLEATRVEPYVLLNLLIGIAFLLLVTGLMLYGNFFRPVVSLSVGFVTGIMAFGFGMYVSIRKIFPTGWRRDLQYLTEGFLVNVIIAALIIILRNILPARLPVLVGLEIFVMVVYLGALWLLRANWLRVFVGHLTVRPS